MTTIKAHNLVDFCRRYGIGRTKAYEEINAGRLKARKNGRSTIVTEEDGQAWLEGLPEFPTPQLRTAPPNPPPKTVIRSTRAPNGQEGHFAWSAHQPKTGK